MRPRRTLKLWLCIGAISFCAVSAAIAWRWALHATPPAAVAKGLLPRAAGLHPQDGPDVDLRARISEERVRIAVQMNLAFMDEIIDVPREDQESIEGGEWAAVQRALRAHYAEQRLAIVDGLEIPPTIEDFGFDRGDETQVIYFPKEGMKALSKVRFVLDHPLKSPPERVALRWFDYPKDRAIAFPWIAEEDIPLLSAVAELTAGSSTELVTLTKEEPEHTWHRPKEGLARRLAVVPQAIAPPADRRFLILGLGLGAAGGLLIATAGGRRRLKLTGVGLALLLAVGLGLACDALWTPTRRFETPQPEQALAIFRPLHANIYAAFDFDRESDIFDALAQSVAGDLLEDLYTGIHRSLILEEAGNAVARVKSVQIHEAKVLETGPNEGAPSFVVETRWQVYGSVFHFRHTHDRTSEYLARYTVQALPVGWRIVAHEPLEQRRLEGAPRPL